MYTKQSLLSEILENQGAVEFLEIAAPEVEVNEDLTYDTADVAAAIQPGTAG